ncbi:FAS1 domain-containing protein [Chytriomyces sp. MP71]|nr:FAS1 domain-containing protein [Chytriomyces sp. MP71]
MSESSILSTLSTITSWTIFAPTDDALATYGIASLSLDALEYHLVPNCIFPTPNFLNKAFLTTAQGNDVIALQSENGININTAKVLNTVTFDGGNILIIDAVLVPPANVVNVARAAGLTSLLDAATTADLTDALAGLQNVTILAPINDAFASIASLSTALTQDQLKQVLLYHIIPGIIHSTDIFAARSIPSQPTLDGTQVLSITSDGDNVYISGTGNSFPASVVTSDVLADHVLIHIIDTVMIPNFHTPYSVIGALGARK